MHQQYKLKIISGGSNAPRLSNDRIMQNPYLTQAVTIKEAVAQQLPYGLETTANLLLEFMAHSDDEQMRDTAAFIKVSSKFEEICLVFNFAMSLLQHDVAPIRESIYDTGMDGIRELNDHLADKYGKTDEVKVNAKVSNFINWLILRLPAKEEMKKMRVIL